MRSSALLIPGSALALIAAVLIGSARTPALSAQSAPAAPALVALHFLAVGPSGDPVTDLRTDEVSVRLGGRARAVRSLQFVSVPGTAVGGPSVTGVPAAFATNSPGADGRALLLIVDDESIGPGDERRLRQSLEALLDTLSPHDRVAIITVPHGGARVDFTNDLARVRMTLEQIAGRAHRQNATIDLSCQARQTLEAIGAAASGIRSGGLPIAVVLSGGLMGPRRELDRIGTARAPSACDVRLEDFQAVARAAQRSQVHFWIARAETANATLFPVEDAAGRSTNLLVGLEQLAGATRAPLLNLTGSDGTALTRIARESSGYYVVGVEVDAADRGDQPRALDVRVSRPDVAVRVQPEVTVDAVPAVRPAPISPEELLTLATERRDLPMRAVAYVSRESATTLRIAAIGETTDASATITAAAIGLVDGNNRLAGQWSATPADLSGRIAAAFAGPAGPYRVRVAAIDALGRAGTVDYVLNAELSGTTTLKMSELVLGVTREAGFAPRLSFGREPVATAYVEIYGAEAGANIQAVIDVAASANGPALITQAATYAATAEPDRFVATAALPIGALAPGSYVVRATMGLQGQPGARVTRELRKGG